MEATTSVEAAPEAISRAPERASHVRRTASDERLVRRIRRGDDEAFAALYERYHSRLLSFCRHMLGSTTDAEDAVQQAFVNAYRAIVGGEKDLRVRPWLYKIARNQCLSVLRARRPEAELDADRASLRGLSEELAERTELRDLLRDLGHLPRDQREALVLAELNDNSHAEVAEILGCDREKVKSLVFQARSSLIKSREARALSCEEVQRQLSILSGGSLRRAVLRRHLDGCPVCRAFHEDVKRQRAALALVLPVAPSVSSKFGAAAALAAAKATAATGTGAAASTGTVGGAATLGAKLLASGTAVKSTAAALAVSAAVGAGAAGVELARHRVQHSPPPAKPARAADRPAALPAADPARRPARERDPAAGRTGRASPRSHDAPAGRPVKDATRPAVPGARGGRTNERPLGAGPARSARGNAGQGNRLERPERASPDRTRVVPQRSRERPRSRARKDAAPTWGGESPLPAP